MTWLFWIIAILFGLVAPPFADFGRGAGIGWETVTVGGIQGVIIPARDAGSLVHGIKPEIPDEDYWTPTLADVQATESAILVDQGALDHTRQYAGFVENGGRKVFVNGFCDTFSADWTREPVLVDDGGDCFFTAVYNVDRDELETFRFNGEG